MDAVNSKRKLRKCSFLNKKPNLTLSISNLKPASKPNHMNGKVVIKGFISNVQRRREKCSCEPVSGDGMPKRVRSIGRKFSTSGRRETEMVALSDVKVERRV